MKSIIRNSIVILFYWPCIIYSQQCELTLSGYIKDPHDNLFLEFASVLLEESGKYAETDSNGFFQIKDVCPGDYHLIIRHIGCETKKLFIQIQSDTILHTELEHHAYFLQSVTVKSSRSRNESATQNTLNINTLTKEAGQALPSLLENIPGVFSIKNGSGISKPVIHGLTGNRVGILNNGVLQAGQQWGTDHAPEIDPFSVQQITVIKGVDVIAYGGNSLGGMVLLEPGAIAKDPHLHGTSIFAFQTNGKQFYLNSKIEKSGPRFEWRITAGMKRGGDHKSPDYFLTNTGIKEYSSSLEINKNKSNRIFHHFYYSFFHVEPGILRGSHIGNLTDLQNSIGAAIPLFTKDQFSYQLESPRQKVNHHLLKMNHKLNFGNHIHEFLYSAQLNHRSEFDVRRGSRSDIPALDLLLQSYNAEYKSRIYTGDQELNYGIQYKFTYNRNQPGTGIFPLIPDYILHNGGLFANWKCPVSKSVFEMGARIDLNKLYVDYYSPSGTKALIHSKHNFLPASLAFGFKHDFGEFWKMRINGGLTQRSPEVNELYSYGLHQAVAGIEQGNQKLNPENSFKTIITNTLAIKSPVHIEVSTYYNSIRNFIFLEPQKEFKLTIRGAFPAFVYKQTNAHIYGLDLLVRAELNYHLQLIINASYIKAYDLVRKIGLIYTPPTQISSTLNYQLQTTNKNNSIKFELNGKYTFKQKNIDISQDILEPPPSYFLLNPSIESEFQLFAKTIKLNIQFENVLNTKYRNYLNRLRYFADEEGINIRFSLKMDF